MEDDLDGQRPGSLARGCRTSIKKNSGKRSGDFVLICSADNYQSAEGYGKRVKRGEGQPKGKDRGGLARIKVGIGYKADWLAWQKLPKLEARYVQHANTRLEIIFVINCTS